ncbi:MAG: terminase large subunit [Selenomonadaceae bacterium]|nr:terminase large subunit [Selenomonadaceae bacterium]
MEKATYRTTKLMAKTSRYDSEKADFAVDFMQCLTHTKGRWAGAQFLLLPWQEKIIRDLFGVVKPNGYRQFNTAYIEIPKKNGKSELAAAVALFLLCADGEERAEIYGCAADRQQASIVFNVAADMVRMCHALYSRCKILGATKRIIYKPTNSIYQVLSSESPTKHGLNCSGVVFDELHAQPDRRLFDVMTKGSGDARTQPLYFLITTAGNDTNSICFEQHQKALDIMDGRKHDATFYPVIYGAAENEDWTSPDVWAKANPSLGVTIDVEKVKAACESAKQNPAEENSFRQLRLNQWTKQATRWLSVLKWDACKFDFDESDLEGRVCYGGLDLASTTDLTAFVLTFPPTDDDDKFFVLPYFWLPEETIDLRVKRDHVPYDLWERGGFLNVTEGNVVDYGAIEEFIARLGEKFNIREICFDRWNATYLTQRLEGEHGFTMVQFGQGFASMSAPTKEFEKLVLERRIAHNGHAILRWNIDNIIIRRDAADNIKIDKAKSTEKVDGAVALVMSLARAIFYDGKQGTSVYDSRGLIFI